MPDDPFAELRGTLRALAAFYLRCMALSIGFIAVVGLWPPVAVAAFLLTLLVPILSLVLWGRSLDRELGWNVEDEGPW